MADKAAKKADRSTGRVEFEYLAMDAAGRELKGTLEAGDEMEVVAKLKQQDLFPIKIWQAKQAKKAGKEKEKDKPKAPKRSGSAGEGTMQKLGRILGLGAVLKTKILCIFTRQLSTMLDAGLPLLLSLRTLQEQCGRSLRYKPLKIILTDIVGRVEGGMSLSEALSAHPRSFNRLYVGLVRAGEASGAMETVLSRLAEYIEKSERMKKKVKAGMTYPVVVLTIALSITLGLMIFIVPKFATMFDELLEGVPLPGLTMFVMGISNILVNNVKELMGSIFLLVVFANITFKTKAGKYMFDWFSVTMPPLNMLVVKTCVGRFCQTLGTLLQAGVPILDALQITNETATNELMRKAIERVYNSVSVGEKVAAPLEKVRIFPGMVVRMIDIGEQTGALPDMLMRIGKNYDEEVEQALESLISLIEPLMIVFLAVVIGGIVLALFLPLIKIIETLGGG
ncbi:MAG: hypothetical protein A3K19_14135 [Lentisphaerae bacterium RIFOXYB12_FULL_65_16]|nr:MAG: hypothetical protein A3K18_16350 [Lentisphaerae bacterium RIFOXYA12_64_32]OGV89105.1 MAG: hypothetical protein A3K19_14135 [Lentisphaerae bacterium RIFOXYB12_FULL_65_16]